MRRLGLTLALLFLLIAARSERAVTLQAGDTAHCTSSAFVATSAVDVKCVEFTATPTATAVLEPTSTATATPTNTPAPEATSPATATATATAPAVATATATATPTLTGGTPTPLPMASWPLCPSHDMTQYHSLIDSARQCHYDHTHQDDPHAVDDIFGPPGAWFGSTQSISYPWQTYNAASGVLENIAKHNGYKWGVRRDLACTDVVNPNNTWQIGCVKAFRVQAHALGTTSDSSVEFHSFSLEALVCRLGSCGIIRGGGWQDYGSLAVVTNWNPFTVVCPPLGSPQDLLPCAPGTPERLHVATTNPLAPSGSGDIVPWYGNHPLLSITVRQEPFGDIDPANPTVQQFGAAYRNNSRFAIGNLFIDAYTELSTGTRWLDRYGKVVTGCTSPALDCVPLVTQNLPIFYGIFHRTAVNEETESDLTPAGIPSWILFPN